MPDAVGERVKNADSPETPRVVYRPSGSTEAFFRSDGEEPGPVVVVQHIQKTAGTSLRRVVRANLPDGEVEITADLRSIRYAREEALAWYRDWYRSLADERRARLSCVMSHSAGYLLPALDRPAEALVLVRDAVDRVVSFYGYKRRNYYKVRSADDPFLSLEEVYVAAQDPDRPPRPLKLESWDQFFNWQSRCLLSIFHDTSELPASAGPSSDADIWRARLCELVDKVFVVGVQDRFAEYVELLARRYGWKAFVPRSKVSKQKPLAAIPADLRETILDYNWLDAELYELCRRSQERRESEVQVPR